MTKARDIASAIPAPSTVSSAELGYLDGVTSAIQTQLDAKTAKSTLSTTGDIYYASAANTPARLGIGSTDQVLKVTAGVPAWATPASGGMTLINSGGTALTGTTTTISSIPGTYKDLKIVLSNIRGDAGGNIVVRFNGDNNANRHTQTNASDDNNISYGGTFSYASGQTNNSDTTGNCTILITDYANATVRKIVWAMSHCISPHNSANYTSTWKQLLYNQTTAITSLEFFYPSANFTGGTVYVYGVS